MSNTNTATTENGWTVQENDHTHSVLELREIEGVPVLVHTGGFYPNAMHPDGRNTRDGSHIDVAIYGVTHGDGRTTHTTHTNVSVTAVGSWHGGRRRSLAVWSMDGRTDSDPTALVQAALDHVPEALETLRGSDAAYEAVISRDNAMATLPMAMDRAEYERTCDELGAQALSDEECDSYGVRYGAFSFPEYDEAHCLKMSLAGRRLAGIEREREQVETSKPEMHTPEKTGQLWEECEHCGAEPIYMPLMLCDRCWPTGSSAISD